MTWNLPGVTVVDHQSQFIAVQIDDGGEWPADDFQLLSGLKLIGRLDAVDLGQQLRRNIVFFGNGVERFARLHDTGRFELVLGGVNHRAG